MIIVVSPRQLYAERCRAISSGKNLRTVAIGIGIERPRPQIDARPIADAHVADQRHDFLFPTFLGNLAIQEAGCDCRHLLRADAARHAFAAGFVAEKFERIDRLTDHVAGVVVHRHPRSQRGRRAECAEDVEFEFEIEELEFGRGRIESPAGGERLPGFVIRVVARQTVAPLEHRRQESAGRTRWRESLELPAAPDALAIFLAFDEFAQGQAHGHLVDARSIEIAGDREKPAAFRAVDAFVRVGLAALDRDEWDPGIGFDVADECRHVQQAVGFQLRGHVARLTAPVGHGLDERALLAADVAAGADENGHRERAAEFLRVRAAHPERFRTPDLGAAAFDLFGVFVPDVDEALRRFGEQSRDDHRLDDRVRVAQENLAVLERARFAFVAVDDDERAVIHLAAAQAADGVAHVLPFLAGRDAGAAEAAQVGRVEFLEKGSGPAADLDAFGPIGLGLPGADGGDDVRRRHRLQAQPAERAGAELLELIVAQTFLGAQDIHGSREGGVTGGGNLAHGVIGGRGSLVRIEFRHPEGGNVRRVEILGGRPGGHGGRDDVLQIVERTPVIIMLVVLADDPDAGGRRAVTSPETGRAVHGDVLADDGIRQVAEEFLRAGEVAGKISADMQGHLLGRGQLEVREEARDGLEAVEGHAGVVRILLERAVIEVSVLVLDALQLGNEGRAVRFVGRWRGRHVWQVRFAVENLRTGRRRTVPPLRWSDWEHAKEWCRLTKVF